MKDHETLQTHHVKDGLTVHLVIKTPRPVQAQPESAPPPLRSGNSIKLIWSLI